MTEFMTNYLAPFFWMLLGTIVVIGVVLGATAYLTLAERKVLGAIQLRKGPNVVGPLRASSTYGRWYQGFMQGNYSSG